MKKLLLIVGIMLLTTSCTDNARSRAFGGTMTVTLPSKQKLVNVTWKDGSSLWYLTRPRRSNEVAESYQFAEKSALGIVEGKVVFNETN